MMPANDMNECLDTENFLPKPGIDPGTFSLAAMVCLPLNYQAVFLVV